MKRALARLKFIAAMAIYLHDVHHFGWKRAIRYGIGIEAKFGSLHNFGGSKVEASKPAPPAKEHRCEDYPLCTSCGRV